MTKAERTKQFIIEKAAGLINKKGMAGTSLSDIMEATKLAKGGLYGNFENKEAICHEAFKYLADKQFTALCEFADKQKMAREKLFALLDFYNRKQPVNTGGCHMLNFGTEADDTDIVMKKKVQESMDRLEKKIASFVTEGIRNKEFEKTFDAANFASKAFAMIEGAIFAGKLNNTNRYLLLVTAALKKEIEDNIL